MEIALKASFFLSSSNNAPLVSLDTAAVVCTSGLHQQMRVLPTITVPARHHGCLTSSRETSSGSNLDEDLTGGRMHTHLLCSGRLRGPGAEIERLASPVDLCQSCFTMVRSSAASIASKLGSPGGGVSPVLPVLRKRLRRHRAKSAQREDEVCESRLGHTSCLPGTRSSPRCIACHPSFEALSVLR
jgi:hypothetical protein